MNGWLGRFPRRARCKKSENEARLKNQGVLSIQSFEITAVYESLLPSPTARRQIRLSHKGLRGRTLRQLPHCCSFPSRTDHLVHLGDRRIPRLSNIPPAQNSLVHANTTTSVKRCCHDVKRDLQGWLICPTSKTQKFLRKACQTPVQGWHSGTSVGHRIRKYVCSTGSDMKTEERAVEAGCYRFDGCTSVRIKENFVKWSVDEIVSG